MAKRRKVGNLLALMVLSLLTERPMHPYEMVSHMRERGTEYHLKVKWGSLYTVVNNLEKHGFIEATGTSRQGRRPERTVYAITDDGRAELTDWMRELVGVPEKEHLRFQAALSILGVLHPDEAVHLLEQRVRLLDAEAAASRAALEQLGKEIPRMFLIESEYEVALREAEAAWIRGLLAELRDGSIPGVAGWREFHETGRLPAEFQHLVERSRPDD
jgi:DNA-binding PadR family transcriptional regulator